jgi:hypothetical protein
VTSAGAGEKLRWHPLSPKLPWGNSVRGKPVTIDQVTGLIETVGSDSSCAASPDPGHSGAQSHVGRAPRAGVARDLAGTRGGAIPVFLSVMRWATPGGLGSVFKNPLTVEDGKVDFPRVLMYPSACSKNKSFGHTVNNILIDQDGWRADLPMKNSTEELQGRR